jgi:Dolichyl-phosphate-mannose-protein mannosyltransferase
MDGECVGRAPSPAAVDLVFDLSFLLSSSTVEALPHERDARAYIEASGYHDRCQLLEPDTTMTESPASSHWQERLRYRLEDTFRANPGCISGFVLLLAFLLRLWKASATFLNLDEAMHFLAANKLTLADAYQTSLNLAHPPLLILFLHEWRKLGTSELFLRSPSVVAGTIFCWIFFRWLTRLLGPVVGWIGFILVSFLPVFIELSAEVRQYALLLCFMMASAYLFELAMSENSAGKMVGFFIFLYLAMLTHFSAVLFAGAVGAYSLWRLVSHRPASRLVAVWIVGQAGAVGLLVFLYVVQISKLKGSSSAQHMQLLLANSYFHWGHEHLLGFVFARTFGVLQYTFGQLALGDIAGILFVAGIVLLWMGKDAPERPGPSSHQLGFFLITPFAINCLAAIFDLYPYGGTRHSAFLLPFAIAGVSLALMKLSRRRIASAIGVAVLMIVVCQLFGAPHRPYMKREDQRRENMTQAMAAIQQSAAPKDIIFVDFQTSFLLRFYLCPEISFSGLPPSDFRAFSCGGHRVIATSSETNVFTADSFPRRWNELVSAYELKAGQTIWVFQAGWDIGLAQELQGKLPEFRELKPEFFGRNISWYKLTVGQTMPSPVAKL